jgi:hypothetical protein
MVARLKFARYDCSPCRARIVSFIQLGRIVTLVSLEPPVSVVVSVVHLVDWVAEGSVEEV